MEKKENIIRKIMNNSTYRAIIAVSIVVIALLLIFCLPNFSRNSNKNINDSNDVIEEPIKQSNELENKTIELKSLLFSEAMEASRLIISENEISTFITVSDDERKWDIFKWFDKNQDYEFHGIASYYVELNELTNEDIVQDDNKHIVYISVPDVAITKNEIKIDQQKTVIYDIDKGSFLAFGDVIKAEDVPQVIDFAEDCILEEAQQEVRLDAARYNAEKKLKELFNTVISDITDSYSVEIIFK